LESELSNKEGYLNQKEINNYLLKIRKDIENIPLENFNSHNWREDIKKIGIIPADLINKLSKGHMKEEIPLKINNRIVEPKYELVLSVGQVFGKLSLLLID